MRRLLTCWSVLDEHCAWRVIREVMHGHTSCPRPTPIGRSSQGGIHMFEGFTLDRIDTGEAILTVRHGGSGSAVLPLHGHPRTHATWHRVAPLLARYYSVVCPDLRGYGTSSKPPTTPDHAPYSKRVMAGDVLAVMRVLAYDRFAVVGHDRGAYVAFRLPWII